MLLQSCLLLLKLYSIVHKRIENILLALNDVVLESVSGWKHYVLRLVHVTLRNINLQNQRRGYNVVFIPKKIMLVVYLGVLLQYVTRYPLPWPQQEQESVVSRGGWTLVLTSGTSFTWNLPSNFASWHAPLRVCRKAVFLSLFSKVPFLPLAGCALAKVAVAQTQDSDVVYSLHPWAEVRSQTKQSSNTSALWDHAEMEGTWNPSNPIVHLQMWGQKVFFWWQKVVARQKVSKVLSPCLGDRVQSPYGHTARESSCNPGSLNLKCLLPTFNLLSCQCNFHCSQLALLWPK